MYPVHFAITFILIFPTGSKRMFKLVVCDLTFFHAKVIFILALLHSYLSKSALHYMYVCIDVLNRHIQILCLFIKQRLTEASPT